MSARVPSPRVFVAPSADARLTWALERLAGWDRRRPAVIVGGTLEAARRLVRAHVRRAGPVLGWQPTTLAPLAVRLAIPALAARGLAPASGGASAAVVARVLCRLRDERALGRYQDIADEPGLPAAVARTLTELRLRGAGPAASLEALDPGLAAIASDYGEELPRLGLADQAEILAAAAASLRGARPPWMAGPCLLLDVTLAPGRTAELASALIAAVPRCCATLPAGDRPAEDSMVAAGATIERGTAEATTALERAQRHLFGGTPAETGGDDSLAILSAPGEMRECVELVRHVLAEARAGTPLDRMAILLRSPETYRPHLPGALRRAGIPAYLSRGTRRPSPTGRALLALLDCAADGLSARAFAEYLSLAVVPARDADGAPPDAPAPGDRFEPADDDATTLGEPPVQSDAPVDQTDDGPAATGALPSPRRWERLLVDAAVIGGLDRWRRRLAGLDAELAAQEDALARSEDPDDPRTRRVARDRAALQALRRFALPLLELLDGLPAEASWATWLEALSALVCRAVRDPAPVLAVLAELEPLGAVGPVGLPEVRRVLAPRLGELLERPTGSPAGKLMVCSVEEARGLSFDVVFVPGLAERLFPPKIAEDPILLDGARAQLDVGLPANADRIEAERLALRLAVGAARRRLVLSYPRLDGEQARPRVPSFYALEVVRAAEGSRAGFRELIERARATGATRLRWPAPVDPALAIDETEYDLCVLERLLDSPEAARGAASYLLEVNPHLARALRFRARRWGLSRWTRADGLVEPGEGARAALEAHAPARRAYSPTALQSFAACPYRFFLRDIARVEPHEPPAARIDQLTPLQRGRLIHQVQYRTLARLRAAGRLPLAPDAVDDSLTVLEEVLTGAAAHLAEELAPAIDSVWQDGIALLRKDLRRWLRVLAASGWTPAHFELAFGLPAAGSEHDTASRPEPVDLPLGPGRALRLRGAIDLVERKDGALRATDHKTGQRPARRQLLVGGGQVLQPVLYALALEQLFPDQPVAGGRLHYCTARGDFHDEEVVLAEPARRAIAELAGALAGQIDAGLLPAAPAPGACARCDYAVVCGPYEELRTRHKGGDTLRALTRLRRLP